MKIKIIQKIIDKLRGKKKKIANNLDISNIININPADINKIRLQITGKNNIITIGRLSEKMLSEIDISICGDNCSVCIGDNFYTSQGTHILLGCNHENYGKIKDTHLTIGTNTTIEGARIITFNSHSTISIGNDCMFSEHITIYNTDSHPIYDITNGKIINYVKNITIGNHCWVGMDVKIMKNTSIADNCIIGAGAIVTSPITQANSIAAGIPAKIVKENTTWKRSDKNWIQGIDNVAI